MASSYTSSQFISPSSSCLTKTSSPVQQKGQLNNNKSKSHLYACFEQPETIKILKYLSEQNGNKLVFDSGAGPGQGLGTISTTAALSNHKKVGVQDHQQSSSPKTQTQGQSNLAVETPSQQNISDRKAKQFKYQRIYHRDGRKFKYAFAKQITSIVSQLFKGLSQSVFIYGTEQSKKDKILIGESQNSGLLLTALNQIFDYCHDKQIEDQVTVKLSCVMFKDGQFVDPFDSFNDNDEEFVVDDQAEAFKGNEKEKGKERQTKSKSKENNQSKSRPKSKSKETVKQLFPSQNSIQRQKSRNINSQPQHKQSRNSQQDNRNCTILKTSPSKHGSSPSISITNKNIRTSKDNKQSFLSSTATDFQKPQKKSLKIQQPGCRGQTSGSDYQTSQKSTVLMNKGRTGNYHQLNGQTQSASKSQITLCQDLLKKRCLLGGSPQIIVRNMRTVLKIINLISRKMKDRREMKQQTTQNLIFTVRLEIDVQHSKYTGETLAYSLPKLTIVKLANPSVDSTLHGVNKNNQWFISLFNFLQNGVLQERAGGWVKQKQKGAKERKSGGSCNKGDTTCCQFTDFIKSSVLDGSSDIHCFTSISNKMSSNECLTALIFNNYLAAYKTKPQKTIINLTQLASQKSQLQRQLMGVLDQQSKRLEDEFRQILSKTKQKQQGQQLNCINSINNSTKDSRGLHSQFSSSMPLPPMSTYMPPSSTATPFNNKLATSKQKHSPSILLMQSSKKSKQKTKQKSSKKCLKGNNSRVTQVIPAPQPVRQQSLILTLLLCYMEHLKEFMNCQNVLEYEYAGMLSEGCEKLSKYIMNEEIEEFYYSKKVSVEFDSGMRAAVSALLKKKRALDQIQDKVGRMLIFQRKQIVNDMLNTSGMNAISSNWDRKSSLSRTATSGIQLMPNKQKSHRLAQIDKQKNLFEQLFSLYRTMALHYLYEDNQQMLQTWQKKVAELEQKQRQESKLTDAYQQQLPRNHSNIQALLHQQLGNVKQSDDQQSQQQSGEGGRSVDQQGESQLNSETMLLNDITNEKIHQALVPPAHSTSAGLMKQLTEGKSNKNKSSTVSQMPQQRSSVAVNDTTFLTSYKKNKKSINQLDCMFTNSNVGVVRPNFNKTVYLTKK